MVVAAAVSSKPRNLVEVRAILLGISVSKIHPNTIYLKDRHRRHTPAHEEVLDGQTCIKLNDQIACVYYWVGMP